VRRLAFGITLSVLIVSIPVLVRLGWSHAVSGEGAVTAAGGSDPEAPGYRAIVSPTPTLLVAHRAPDGTLAGVALLAAAGERGGAVVLVPTTLVVDADGARPRTLEAVFAAGGTEALRTELGRTIGVGFDRVVAADGRDWATALGSGTRVVVDNPDELLDTDGSVRFTPGKLTLTVADVERFLRLRSADEDERSRLYRNELMWEAILHTVATQPPAGGSDPLRSMLENVAGGDAEVTPLPVVAARNDLVAKLEVASTTQPSSSAPADASVAYVLDSQASDSLIATVVPFPISAFPGDRVRVRLLDGIGDAAATLGVSSMLVPAGAEITVFGNADRFDYRVSEVRFYDEAQRSRAEAMASALGVASAEFKPAADTTVDVEVVVGKDLAEPGAEPKASASSSRTTR